MQAPGVGRGYTVIMSTTARLPVRIRLLLSFLTLLQRFVQIRAFRSLLRVPLWVYVHVWWRYRMYSLAFGASPKAWTANPQTAELMRQLEALRNKPMRIDGATDREPKLSQAMTWGVAGFALIALIQILTQQQAHTSAARWVACGCFALVIPWLAVLGLVAHDHMDPRRPPTIQQCLNMHAAMYAGNLIFCLGFTSLLWSFNRSIACIFVLSCYVAMRRFLAFAKKRATTSLPASAIIRLR
jgi:hypothetical protein